MVTATRKARPAPKLRVPTDWSPDGSVNIIDGQGYCLTQLGQTICIGPVDADGKPLEKLPKPIKAVTENPPNPHQTPPAPKKRVSKLKQVETVGVNDSQIQNGGSFATSKKNHLGGRPRKEGPVHRAAGWRRRKKELQGVLL